jgi:hypothetical protein
MIGNQSEKELPVVDITEEEVKDDFEILDEVERNN